MKERFEILAEAAKKVVDNCPWTGERTVEEYAQELRKEADEVVAAIESGDSENLKEELGDLLWDTIVVALLAERDGKFRAADIMQDVVEKMKRRKPFVFEGRKVTIEEAEALWAAGKAREKRR